MPALYFLIIASDSPFTPNNIGLLIAADSKILEGMTVLNNESLISGTKVI